jgi:two-component sensor histidine kinase
MSNAMSTLSEQVADTQSLAQIIVSAVREPLLVLDTDLRVVMASASFHRSFELKPENVQNRKLFSLDNGAWDFDELRTLLQLVLRKDARIEGFEIAHDFPRIGRRVLLLRASRAGRDEPATLLLGIEDVTERRAIEKEKERLQAQTDDLLRQKEFMIREMQHRIVNSLQIIASILMLKSRAVASEETRQQLQDAHRRVLSVAAVQQHLHTSLRGDLIDIAPYLKKLCESLADSMIGDDRPGRLQVVCDDGSMASTEAVSLGLIVTELVINALKYAFPIPNPSALVTIRYEVNGSDWKLSVSDNGIGRIDAGGAHGKGGLGTSLVNALANQLDAQVETISGKNGLTVSVSHASFTSRAAARRALPVSVSS